MVRMRTTGGVTYTLADDGTVLDRSDGPRGWNYSGQWRVLGFLTRAHSQRMVSFLDALAGAEVGHGFVVDLDHGTRRVWMGSPGRLSSLEFKPDGLAVVV